MTQKLYLFLSLLLILFALPLVIGCSAKTVTPTETSPTGEAGYHIKFFLKDKQVASLGITELQTLPKVSLSAFSVSEEGPTLLSVLELAGIKEFTKVQITGMVRGRIASAQLTLNRDEITPEVILDFTNRGTAKLAGAKIPQDNWVIDVSEIRAE
jgi:hypothetical protein